MLSAHPCEATYIPGFPLSNAEPASRWTIRGDLDKKEEREEKQAADFALLWVLAARSEPAPLQVYSLAKMS